MAAAIAWTSSVAFMIDGTVAGSEDLMHWGVFVALIACIVSGWLIADCAVRRERVRVEAVVEATVKYLADEGDVTRLH